MRKAFAEAVVKHVKTETSVFMTGDLGFMALEPVRDAFDERFINAGVAEQNMISVAAGLAKTGLEVWAYSIAPFCYARPFEQIRNDVCLHRLPVHLVGNGGGYGYGVMGSTHHAIEDYGVLLALQGMRAYVPASDADLDEIVPRMQQWDGPSYLRLGRDEMPSGLTLPAYQPWRRLTTGAGPLIAVAGPLAGSILKAVTDLEPALRPELWVVSELPLEAFPPPMEFAIRLDTSPAVWAVEEHVAQGGFGRMLSAWVLENGYRPKSFRHWRAEGYPSGTYGSQEFHRAESGISAPKIRQAILESSVFRGAGVAP
uniref:Transketolase, central region n=1 Tax=Solibacter usitatus (strain Ellin6076) TaxID=234267 RepID=Q02BA8_SOLUE